MESKGMKKASLTLIVFAIGVLAVVIAVGIFYSGGINSNSSPTPTPTVTPIPTTESKENLVRL
jgi:hypothetical protein